MNYLKKLKNRSVFLWKVLFQTKTAKKLPPPVYIDRAPVQQMLPGAYVNESKKLKQSKAEQSKKTILQQNYKEHGSPQKVQQTKEHGNRQKEVLYDMQREEQQERVLRGVEEMETAVLQAALQQKRPMISEQVHQDKENQSAQMLLNHVQETAQSGRYPQTTAAHTQQIIGSTREQQASAAPEKWSAYFEKDARRYDGAYELL